MERVHTLLIGLVVVSCLSSVQASETPELVRYMSALQYLTHKAGLAIQAENRPLSDFYAHEMEEVLEAVSKIPRYDGHPIGELADRLIEPAFHDLEEALDQGRWAEASTRYDALLDACNRCHAATNHGFIRIKRNDNNPYMQSFD